MWNRRWAFATVWLGTPVLVFIAAALENAGFKFQTIAGELTAASAVGSIVLMFLAFLSFWKSNFAEVIPTVIGLACCPFVLGMLLSFDKTEPNVHGSAILGFFFYAFVAEVIAVTLLIRTSLNNRRNADS